MERAQFQREPSEGRNVFQRILTPEKTTIKELQTHRKSNLYTAVWSEKMVSCHINIRQRRNLNVDVITNYIRIEPDLWNDVRRTDA